MAKQRTYWHLADLPRKPTEYDIVTSRLLYYVGRGFEVRGPFAAWHERYVRNTSFRVDDWEAFRDPRETTYTSYTALQQTHESFIDELLKSVGRAHYDEKLDREWVTLLGEFLGAIRFPLHGLQMAASYVGQLAPSGRIVITSLFQAADEMRRIQRFAYRLAQLRETYADLAPESRLTWERNERWQPLRRAIEELLVTYEWGEAFAALNLCAKPAIDSLFVSAFADLARASGDTLFAQLLFSLDEDCRWHREWTASLVRMAVEARPENAAVLQRAIAVWDPRVKSALAAFAPLFETAKAPIAFTDVWAGVETSLREHRLAAGIAEAAS